MIYYASFDHLPPDSASVEPRHPAETNKRSYFFFLVVFLVAFFVVFLAAFFAIGALSPPFLTVQIYG